MSLSDTFDPSGAVNVSMAPSNQQPTPQMLEEQKRLRARQAELEGKLETAHEQTEGTAAKIEKAQADIGATETRGAALEKWFAENYPEGNVAPPQYKPVTMQDIQGSIFPLLIGAAIGGLGSRRHYIGALKSFGAMLQGADAGRKEAFEAARTAYQDQLQQVKAQQDAFMKRFNSIIASNKLDMTAKQNALRSLDMEYGRQVGEEQSIERSIDRVYAYDTNLQNTFQRHQDVMIRLGATTVQNTPRGDLSLTGEAYLKTLPIEDREMVKKIANYEVDPKTLPTRGGGGGQRARLLAEAVQYDQGFNQQLYGQRAAVRRDFTSGKTAANITAINTAIGHIGTMEQLTNALQNNDIRLVNELVNRVKTEFGDPKVNNFQTAQQAVANELMRVFRQTGASEQETQEWGSRFSAYKGPDIIKGAISTGVELLHSRLNAVQDQWHRGMGDTVPDFPILGQKSKQVLRNLGDTTVDSGASSGGGLTAQEQARMEELERKLHAPAQ